MNDGKKIAINTIAIYIRLVVVTIVGLITSRYILLTLGQSDFGLYNVVGSIIVLINTIGIAMHTTTRRFINVEMGKGEEGNPNKIFNISIILHVLFAIFFLFIAESIGLWYINNYLQVAEGKIDDANFVFQVSTLVACASLMVVPFQGLLDAFQKFWQVAIADVICALLKALFVVSLVYYDGNALRFYAVGAAVLTFISYAIYILFCTSQWKDIIKPKLYWDKQMYKEMLVFNNYTALGATSCLGRTQGTAMLINYFFGTMVNGALAVANQIQSFTQQFAGNVSKASAPQITQAYSGNNLKRAFDLCNKVTRITILIMICIFFPAYSGLQTLLEIWLKIVPEGALVLCKWTLITSLISSFGASLSTYVHATGKIKLFQIIGSFVEISVLPISFLFFYLGYPPVTILIVLASITLINIIITLTIMRITFGFNSMLYVKLAYFKPLIVILIMTSVTWGIANIVIEGVLPNLMIICAVLSVTALLSFTIGLNKQERARILNMLKSRLLRSR